MTSVVDFAASMPHYVDHLLPLWEALPEERRGIFVAPGQRGSARRLVRRRNVTVVASHGDLNLYVADGRRAVMIEHGAGQSYGGDWAARVARHRAYAGGVGRHGVDLFLHPGPHPAARDRAAYPAARVEVVGALRHGRLATVDRPAPGRVVAFTFHWDCRVCPETRSAWPEYAAAVRAEVRSGRWDEVLLHAHPRLWGDVSSGAGARTGATLVRSFDEVLERVHVLAGDNTTALFDWAALRGPTVVLNSAGYRRDVEHGLRFWSHAGIGPMVDGPAGVGDALEEALDSGPVPAELLEGVWAPVEDPVAAAVAAICEVADGPPLVDPRGDPRGRGARPVPSRR